MRSAQRIELHNGTIGRLRCAIYCRLIVITGLEEELLAIEARIGREGFGHAIYGDSDGVADIGHLVSELLSQRHGRDHRCWTALTALVGILQEKMDAACAELKFTQWFERACALKNLGNGGATNDLSDFQRRSDRVWFRGVGVPLRIFTQLGARMV